MASLGSSRSIGHSSSISSGESRSYATRELEEILPAVCARTLETHVVTSAVRPIPIEWNRLENLKIVVSIDGLQAEHDARRTPATYDRIFKHIDGHRITVHCTITSQMMRRDGYIEEFMTLWSARPEVDEIQVSLFTPQIGTTSVETLSPEMRLRAVNELGRLSATLPKIRVNPHILRAFLDPPSSPRECVFARVTKTVSADLKTVVTPCQFGGNPDCSQYGCLASMGLHAVAEYTLPIGIKIRPIFDVSDTIGEYAAQMAGRLQRAESGSGAADPQPRCASCRRLRPSNQLATYPATPI